MLKEFTFVASGLKGIWDTELKKCFMAMQPGRMATWADMSGATIMYDMTPYISLEDMGRFYCHEDDDCMELACNALLARAREGFFDMLPDAVSEVKDGCSDQSCEEKGTRCGEGS